MGTYTPNLNLYKPDPNDDFDSFLPEFNNNMDILDVGGGGGGGHTIVDPNGSNMPAESKLQFTGNVTVTDDNVNGKTVVNITGGGGGSISYSTTEQVIGTYLSKPLYGLTVVKNYASIMGNATIDVTSDLPNDIKYIRTFEGTVEHDYAGDRDLHIGDRVIDCEKDASSVYVYLHIGSSSLANTEVVFFIAYTKTTD